MDYVLVVLLITTCFTNAHDASFTLQVNRILYKRTAIENTLKDNPDSPCRNGGIFANQKCHCIHPHTGPTCQDFACVHGLSVGPRFDPNSLFFSRPCICNDGWQGELCDLRLTDKCNQRGQWVNNTCQCVGSFFGDYCQYTSRCDFGQIRNGRCICQRHFHGDYCEKAVCYHGYADIANHSRSCVCPAKYKGVHCDQCYQVGRHILPYPHCVVDFVGQQKVTRKKTLHQNKSRMYIITGAILFLTVVGIAMFILHQWHQKRKNPQLEEIRMKELQDRQAMLTKAAMECNLVPGSAQNSIIKRERRRSLPNLFKLRRNSSSGPNLFRVKTDFQVTQVTKLEDESEA
ncbi:unnamed protein product [Auanema sp. JU1783]|nr:unnamed protein product [Auanema sp. JU1783]